MNSKKGEKKVRKRKKSSTQNVSGEKPNKKAVTNTQKSSSNVNKTKRNVNKNKTNQDSTNTVNMATFNVPVYDTPVTQNRQFQPYSMTQPVQNPNFTQQSPNSPAVGFYTSTPQNINSVMQPMVNPYSDTNCKLDDLTQKVNMIFDKMSTLDELSNKISTFDKAVQNLFKTVEKVSKRVDDVEQGMNFINEKFEDAKKDVSDVKGVCAGIREDADSANDAIFRLQKDLDELYTRHIDLQTRSMRENLIFTGIPMHDKFEESETTEKVLEKFMTEQLKLCRIAEYDRAHRFGKEYVERYPDGSVKFMTKPIVCRFRNFKEREFVRKAARELRDTHFGISEQFPKEVNDKRKELWPHFQEARRQRKKAFFKRDRLFIDGVEYCPSKKDEEKRDDDVPRRQYNKQGARPKKLNDPGRRQRRSSPH